MNDRRHENEVVAALLAGDITATVLISVFTGLLRGNWLVQACIVALTLFLALWPLTLLTIMLATVVRVVRDRFAPVR